MIPKLGLWSRGGIWDRPLIPKEVPTPIRDKSTDRARGSRQARQGKWL